jgi:serine phosphatase RsbU (regulator of sigma subunit)
MVTVAKSLFTSSASLDPERFLNRAAATIHGMKLGRMSMALLVACLDDEGLGVAMAGMPPLLVHRSCTNTVDEILLPGLPLGSYRRVDYRSRRIALDPGDTVLMMSDGFPECLNRDGEPLGYERTRRVFADAAQHPTRRIIEELEAGARVWRGERSLVDDMTFMVLRMT